MNAYETRTFSLGIDHVGQMNITGASREYLVKLAVELRARGYSFFLGETDIDSPLEIIDYCDQRDLRPDDPILFRLNA